ncbi:MAG: hypothetical protein LBF59_10415 [Prevotellaceae bacterium]|jgi:hypothetical protein|nr:hypothetical protein [Prevotellaceae bacterium]
MEIYGKIKQKIREISDSSKGGVSAVFTAEVASVSGETCTVRLEDLSVSDVRLRAVINQGAEKLLITPKIGSYVLVADLSGGNYRDLAVVSYSEIESMEYKDAQGFEITVKGGKMSVKNGSYGIKQALDELIDAIGRLTVTTGTGPSGIPINKAEFDAVKEKIGGLLI